MSLRTTFRHLVAMAAVIAMMAAPAGATDHVTGTEPAHVGLVYTEGNILMLSGPPLELGCFDEGFTESTARYRNTPSGNYMETIIYSGEPISLYTYGGGDPFEWLGEQCGAIAAGGEGAEPFATGEGRLIFQLRHDGETLHVHNTVLGQVTDTDGNRHHVNAWAKYTDGPGGFDLTALRINLKQLGK